MPIYFIADKKNKCVKIGYSKHPHKRFKQIQYNYPFRLELLGQIEGDRSKEHEIHSTLVDALIRSEWYTMTDDVVSYIKKQLNIDTIISYDFEQVKSKIEQSKIHNAGILHDSDKIFLTSGESNAELEEIPITNELELKNQCEDQLITLPVAIFDACCGDPLFTYIKLVREARRQNVAKGRVIITEDETYCGEHIAAIIGWCELSSEIALDDLRMHNIIATDQYCGRYLYVLVAYSEWNL